MNFIILINILNPILREYENFQRINPNNSQNPTFSHASRSFLPITTKIKTQKIPSTQQTDSIPSTTLSTSHPQLT